MTIKLDNIASIDDLDNKIDNSYNGTCFAYKWFLDLKDVKNILKIIDNTGNVIGFMPIFIDETNPRKINQSTMYIPYGGPVLFEVPKEERNKIRFIREIEYALANYLKDNFDDMSFSTDCQIVDIMPFIRSGFIPEVRYTYKLDLHKSLKDLYESFGHDRRKEVRRAQNINLKFYVDDKLEDFDCHKALVWEKKHNLPSSKEFVQNYILKSIQENRGMSFVAKGDDQIYGGVHLVWDKETAYILYSYFDKDADLGSITYIYYNMIDYLQNNTTVKYLDFEGSVYESIENFNISFGAYQSRYYNLHWKKDNLESLYPIVYDYGDK